jgi:hypothetical protein
VAKKAVLSSLNDLAAIQYRQDILRDCLKNASVVRDIYDLAVESIDREKKSYWSIFSNYPDATLRKGIEVLQIFVGMLKELRNIADGHADEFESEGFTVFFAMLKQDAHRRASAPIDPCQARRSCQARLSRASVRRIFSRKRETLRKWSQFKGVCCTIY